MVPSYEIAVRIVPITDECNAGSGTEAGQLEGLNKVAFRRFPWIALERWERYSIHALDSEISGAVPPA